VISRRNVLAIAAALLLAACSGDDEPGPQAQAAPPEAPAAGAKQPGGPGGMGMATGRGAAVVTLAASDISRVRRDTIEDAIAITGDLRPIESVDVKSHLEGDLLRVLVREGERVTQGQLLARFESSEQESAQASAEADRVAAASELSTAQWNLEQTNELFRAGAVSERDLKAAQQTLVSARARLAAAQARLRATSSVLRDTRIVAPTAGTVSRKLVESGEHVGRGAELFTVVRSDVLELAAAVPARQANAVRVGQTVHFAADGRAVDGKVARVSPTVDPSTRSVTVYVQVQNANGQLKGGTFVTGRVVSRTVPNALVVPTSAVRQSGESGRPYVYRVAGSTLDVANVQLGIVDERAGMAEVLQGLAEGDRVVVGNVGTLGRGMQVIIAGEERPGANAASARQ
jgi:RND family efflux transporter MFP subunit